MTKGTLDIGIIGAGIGGLTAAIACARIGANVHVFEQAAEISEVGAGLQISANALGVLTALGLDPLSWRHDRPSEITLRSHRWGRKIAQIKLNTDTAQPYTQFHRADLIDALYAAALKRGVTVHLNAKVRPDTVDPDLPVIQGIAFDLMVAADGIGSQLRERFFPDHSPKFINQIAWRALVPKYTNMAQNTGTRVYMGPGKHLVTYPIRKGDFMNIVAVQNTQSEAQEGWGFDADLSNLRAAFAGWNSDVTSLLARVRRAKIWGLYKHAPLPNWSVGKLAFLGDAAHPMVPFVAQGAAMAIEDAWVLADCLKRHSDTKSALNAYYQTREPRSSRVQQTALKSGRIYHVENPLIRMGLHTGMQAASLIAPKLLSQHYDWIYDHDVTKD